MEKLKTKFLTFFPFDLGALGFSATTFFFFSMGISSFCFFFLCCLTIKNWKKKKPKLVQKTSSQIYAGKKNRILMKWERRTCNVGSNQFWKNWELSQTYPWFRCRWFIFNTNLGPMLLMILSSAFQFLSFHGKMS